MSRNGRITAPAGLLIADLGTGTTGPDLVGVLRGAATELLTGFVAGLVIVFGMLVTVALVALVVKGT
jgi:hypothetical protein